MDELLAVHGNHPVCYAPEESGDTAFILHTSGTTTGAGRPVALSDAACNAAAAVFYHMKELPLPMDHLVTAVIVDLSNAYSMIDQVHLPLVMGAKVVLAPGGILNPWFYGPWRSMRFPCSSPSAPCSSGG
jgi:acyl-coenzyme A synthetase/AMP-(fatty) acid ligase